MNTELEEVRRLLEESSETSHTDIANLLETAKKALETTSEDNLDVTVAEIERELQRREK